MWGKVSTLGLGDVMTLTPPAMDLILKVSWTNSSVYYLVFTQNNNNNKFKIYYSIWIVTRNSE